MTTNLPGISVDAGGRFLVASSTEALLVLDAKDGALIDSAAIQGEPIAADDDVIVVLVKPGQAETGHITLVRRGDGAMESTWQVALLKTDDYERVKHGIDEVDVDAEIGETEVVVTGTVRSRYRGGAAPSDEVLAEAEVNLQIAHRISIEDGEILSYSTEEFAIEQTGDGRRDGSATPPPVALLSNPISGEWTIQPPGLPQRTINLELGTEAVSVAANRLIYVTAEDTSDSAVRTIRLRSQPLDGGHATGSAWSVVLDEREVRSEPPIPP